MAPSRLNANVIREALVRQAIVQKNCAGRRDRQDQRRAQF